MMMIIIFQVEFIDKPFVLWHSPESCRLEEKSHEPCLGEMFETRCWPINPLLLWPTLTEAVAEDTTMVIERQILCTAPNPNPKELEHLNSLSVSIRTGEIPKPSFRAVRGSGQRSPKEGDPDLLAAGVFLEVLLIERSTCCIALSSLFRTLVNADVWMVFKISESIDFRIGCLQKDWMGDVWYQLVSILSVLAFVCNDFVLDPGRSWTCGFFLWSLSFILGLLVHLNLSLCSCQMVWWTRNHFTLLFERVGKTIWQQLTLLFERRVSCSRKHGEWDSWYQSILHHHDFLFEV